MAIRFLSRAADFRPAAEIKNLAGVARPVELKLKNPAERRGHFSEMDLEMEKLYALEVISLILSS
jgi:hypothetical protein